MFKKNILNMGGIMLSLFICFGVWYAVVFFIKSSENRILEDQNINNLVALKISEAHVKKKLDSQIISDILTYWSKEAMSIHDVKAGQISLENAIATANDCMDYLTASGLLKDSKEEYSFNFVLYGPSNPEALKDAECYSYWNAVLINSYYAISFRINAVSGEIWYIKIAATQGSVSFTGINSSETLLLYETYLNMPSLSPLYVTDQGAYKVHNALYVSNVRIEENQILLQLLPY